MAYLRFLDDSERLQARLLDAEKFVIGRGGSCHLVLDSEKISREHARIVMEGDGRYRIHDLGSRNKTYVNGELVTETLLTPGAIIRVGDRVIEFVSDEHGAESIDLDFLTPDATEPPDCEWIKCKTPFSVTAAQIEQLSHLIGDQPLTARAEDVADAALGQIILDLEAERGLIALHGEGKGQIRPLAHRALKKSPGASMTPVSQSFVTAAVLQGAAGRYPKNPAKSGAKLGFAVTGLVAPLTHRGEVIGILYVDRPAGKRHFSPSAMQYCAACGAHIGALLGEASRKLAQSASREGATWMSTIRRVQASLSSPAESSKEFDVASTCYAGRLKCGDFGSVIHLDEQRCGVIVLDGGGHGITGIAQSSARRTAVEAAVAVSEEALTDPSQMFNAINHLMSASRARQVLPCLFVGIDLSAGRLGYINAGGMPPLLMAGPGRMVALDQTALVLGVDADYSYETTQVDLPGAFRLVCFTDGLTEATSVGAEAFGDQRLGKALLDHDRFGSAAETLAWIGNAWKTHLGITQGADDALVLVVAHG